MSYEGEGKKVADVELWLTKDEYGTILLKGIDNQGFYKFILILHAGEIYHNVSIELDDFKTDSNGQILIEEY